MIILAHRGLWKSPSEKNSLTVLRRALHSGFGVETDIRDYAGDIVISHDIADASCECLETFLRSYKEDGSCLPLALNIKSDGLHHPLKKLLESYAVTNYFVFDMSVPDTILFLNDTFRVFTRQSEYENPPAFYPRAHGVWLDEFEREWLSAKIIDGHRSSGKDVCIVSGELHGRDYRSCWRRYRALLQESASTEGVMLCTDHPEEAASFFR